MKDWQTDKSSLVSASEQMDTSVLQHLPHMCTHTHTHVPFYLLDVSLDKTHTQSATDAKTHPANDTQEK